MVSSSWLSRHQTAIVAASILIAAISLTHLFLFFRPPLFRLDGISRTILSPPSSSLSPPAAVAEDKLPLTETPPPDSNSSSRNNADSQPSPSLDAAVVPSTDPPPPLDDGRGGVAFRNAPWRAHIGRWLAKSFDADLLAPVHETLHANPCPGECNHQGICNKELGHCRCFHGYAGIGCEERLNLECNLENSTENPYGPWVVSICSAHCDKTRALCFCGEGTKYPDRPAAEACGFVVKGLEVDWTKPDWGNIFTKNSNKSGWCNVDPTDAYDNKVKFKEQCDCKYDCNWGRFCELPTQCVCINQCSGNGICHGGFCQCNKGWYGIDCSVPSSSVSPILWPNWLKPATVEIKDGNGPGFKAIVEKKHPLIYVYDLPPKFNSHLLEGRHWKFQCFNRIYDNFNSTIWTEQLYGAEIALYESLLASPHRTTNGDEADFFYVPVLGACLITRADDAPHLSMQNHMGFRSYLALDLYRQAYHYIKENHPYWNRTAGRDHLWFFSWDEGACFAPKEIWNSTMLVHWGNTNSKYNYSTTCYYPDNWDRIPLEERGNHPCFDPEKDIVLPAWKEPDPTLIIKKFWARPRSERKNLFYFNGNLGNDYEHGRPEVNYSMGIRQKIAEEFGSTPNKYGKLGRHTTSDVIVTPLRSPNYAEDLANSKFCGVFPGDGWSGRMEDSILHGCIPVIIQDGIQLIYENVLNYDSFAIRIAEKDIPQLVNILRSVNEKELELKLSNVRKIWQRFLYLNALQLEASRQLAVFSHNHSWAQHYAPLAGDDAFSTLIQVLHYKLYNDAWCSEARNGNKK